jgi:uncharacterized membrane protein
MEAKFSVSEVLSSSWKTLKANALILIGLFIGYGVIAVIISSITGMIFSGSILGGIINNVIALFISAIFMLGYTKIVLEALAGNDPQFSAFQEQFPKVVTAFLSSLLLTIAVVIGCILFILPGLYLALRLQFYIYFIVDEDAGVIDSLKKSWALTDDRSLLVPLILLMLAYIGLCIVGLICLIVGIFVIAPLIYVMQAKVYTILKA